MIEPRTDTAALRILIVDDTPEDRIAFSRFLRRRELHTYVTDECASIAEAFARCTAQSPDCILLDYNLPDGNGFEFLAQLPREGADPAYPVVMVTGHGNEEVAVTAMKSGALDYVVKGKVTAEALCRTVHKAIEKAHLLRTIRRQQDEKDKLIRELREALDDVKTLRGFIPICANCKQIRNDKGFWQQVEDYLAAHSNAQFSHGICPECIEKLYPTLADRLLGREPS